MIDTHTHIFSSEFNNEVEQVVKRANDDGVKAMVLPAIDSKTHQQLFDICNEFKCCYPAIGLHPTSVDATYKQELDIVDAYYKKHKDNIVAIGEVGIDLYWSSEFLKEQKDAFAFQMDMALEHDLPLIIHTRNAYDEMFDILNGYKSKPIRGVFHSYDQSVDTYKKMSNFDGFYFGIGGVVTFKKSTIYDSVAHLPLDRIVLETDAPYLTPSPYRGKRNEPSYLKYIAQAIATAKGISLDDVEKATDINAEALFSLK